MDEKNETPVVAKMDIAKAKSAITAARTAVKDIIDVQVKAGSFNALKSLAHVNEILSEAEGQLEASVKRAEPRVKKPKKSKTKKA